MNNVSSLLKTAILVTGFLAFCTLSSCNTFSGLGRDIQNTGSALRNAADQ